MINYPTAEQRGFYKGIVTPQVAGNQTLIRLRRIEKRDKYGFTHKKSKKGSRQEASA